jgi:hypothetical protein
VEAFKCFSLFQFSVTVHLGGVHQCRISEGREFGFICFWRGVFAIEISVLPPLRVAGQSESREIAFLAALDGDAPIRAQRLIFTRWVAVKNVKEEIKGWRNLEIVLTENNKVADVQD